MLAVVTDSGCGITDGFANELGDSFFMVGLKIFLDSQEYEDGKIDKEKFYNHVLKGEKVGTSQPSPADFERAYRDLLKKGYDEILSFHISSKVSGTFNAARIAAKNVDPLRIHVVDSLNISAGVYLMLRRIVEYTKSGMPLKEALNMVDVIRKNTLVLFNVSTLDYLVKNGRIGKASGLVGSILKISPILTVKNGENALSSITRGKKRLIAKTAKMCKYFLRGKEHVRIVFAYSASNTLKNMEDLKKVVNESIEIKDALEETLKMWPTITSHTGPTTVGVACYGE